MRQTLYFQFLKEIIKEAIEYSDGTPTGISTYLTNKKAPGFFSRPEKREALSRAKKVFATTQDRPLWFVLSCLGLKQNDLEKSE